MRTNHLVLALLAMGAIALVLTNGCSSSSDSNSPPPPCNADPWTCPTGQTCWVTSQAGAFSCLNSDATKAKGDACVNLIGQPSCGDDMICFQLKGQSSGVCAPFCDKTDPSKACAAGETCVMLLFGNSTANACQPANTPADAGPDVQGQDAGADAPAEAAEDDATVDAAVEAAADVPEAGPLPE